MKFNFLKKLLFKKSVAYKSQTEKKYDNYLKNFKLEIENNLSILNSVKIIDKNFYLAVEELLLEADLSYDTIKKIINLVKTSISNNKVKTYKEGKLLLIETIFNLLKTKAKKYDNDFLNNKNNVFLLTGINGSGKTTTIIKLAYLISQFKDRKVLVIAGDTFRAGAIRQLDLLAKQHNIYCFKSANENQKPSGVIYQGIEFAIKNKYTDILCDVSGRMHTNISLMKQLEKITVIIKKFNIFNIEKLLVLDGNNGQNIIDQIFAFDKTITLTGLIFTKFDSVSKGGIIISIYDKFNLNINYIGTGEKINDLVAFDLRYFLLNFFKKYK